MKKIVLSTLIALVLLIASLTIDASGAGKAYQVVDFYICEESLTLAEMLAKSAVSRQELYVVSYCTCEGVNNDMRPAVKKNSCIAPKDMVYSCICIGKSSY
ncbi:MAG TPA: hypothetical protein PK573_14390 [Spirochaetota bacterium]|nr:hypothetical protein [Spirochaetota bacterium]HRZ26266.1 hypothetical protein [Spirochaetota bacterium]HSA15214.1 hypothetical protein [Spirochaetota bacterium]